jgi:hypothetical protein
LLCRACEKEHKVKRYTTKGIRAEYTPYPDRNGYWTPHDEAVSKIAELDDHYGRKLADAERKAADQHEDNLSLAGKNVDLEAKVRELTEKLSAAEASNLCPCGEKEARLIAAESQVSKFSAHSVSLARELHEANEYIAYLKSREEQWESRHAEVSRKLHAAEDRLRAASDPMREKTWSDRFKYLTDRAEQAEAKVRELEEERDAARGKIASLKNQLAGEQIARSGADANREQLQIRVQQVEEQLKASEQDASQTRGERDWWKNLAKSPVELVDEDHQKTAERLENAELAAAQLKTTIVSLTKDLEFERARIAKLATEIKALDDAHRHVLNQRNEAQDAHDKTLLKLEAATALLRRVDRRGLTAYEIAQVEINLPEDVYTYLSGQSATPSRTETVVASGQGITIKSVSVTPEEHAALNTGGARLPAVGEQALADACEVLRKLNPRGVTKAEQAVLDAWAAVPRADLERALEANLRYDTSLPAVRAELARRDQEKPK